VRSKSDRSPRSSDELQVSENRISGGALRFVVDPLLHQRQPMGRLMDIVAVDDIAEGLQELLETLGPGGKWGRGRSRGSIFKLVLDRSQQL
jgi:hypothetical protein